MKKIAIGLFLALVNFSFGQVLQTVSGTTTLGNGAGITNVWVKTIIPIGYFNTAVSGPATRYTHVGVDNTPLTTVGYSNYSVVMPLGGYASNMNIYSSVTWIAGTNMVLSLQTNSGIAATVNTPLTLTLNPAGGSTYTNSGTTSYVLPTTRSASGDVWVMSWVFNTNAPTESVGGYFEWWHQSP